jgi:hypothetical protein
MANSHFSLLQAEVNGPDREQNGRIEVRIKGKGSVVVQMKKIIFIIMLILIFSATVFAQMAGIEIEDYEKEILIEKGWIRYLSIKVRNSGDVVLNNVEVSIAGEKSSWFDVQTEKINMQPNETASFIIKMYVPSEEEKGTYNFFLDVASDKTSLRESFVVRVFTSRSEMVLFQIQDLRDTVSRLKEEANTAENMGKNVESIKEMLSEAQSLLGVASDFVSSGLYEDATAKIIDAENFIKKAEYELSIAPTKTAAISDSISLEWILIISLIIIIIGMFLFLVFRRHNLVIKVPGLKLGRVPIRKVPGLKVKRFLKENKTSEGGKEEIRRLEDAKSLLDEEFVEGLLSKESYEELKSKYEEKILNLRTKGKK